MQTYLCYVHSVGRLAPDLHRVTARGEAELPDSVLKAMLTWPAPEAIEIVEVYSLFAKRLLRLATGAPVTSH